MDEYKIQCGMYTFSKHYVKPILDENEELKKKLAKYEECMKSFDKHMGDRIYIFKCGNCGIIMEEDDSYGDDKGRHCWCNVWCKDCFHKIKKECDSCGSGWFCYDCEYEKCGNCENDMCPNCHNENIKCAVCDTILCPKCETKNKKMGGPRLCDSCCEKTD